MDIILKDILKIREKLLIRVVVLILIQERNNFFPFSSLRGIHNKHFGKPGGSMIPNIQ